MSPALPRGRRPARGLAVLLLGLLAVLALLAAGPPARAFEDRTSSVVVDAASGVVLDAHKPNHLRYPASLTKMMTVLMLFRALDAGTVTPDTPVPISATAAAANPVKLGLAPGDSLTVAEAIPALIARSANDVAVAVAELLGGTEPLFAHEMTRVARADLGLTRTTFRNASGLPDDAHVTTARDMARLAVALWRDHRDRFDAFAVDPFAFRGRSLRSYNPLLRAYDGADGLKTGFTCAAGYNLAGTAMRDGRRVIAVVMGAASGADCLATIERLMDAGFARLSYVETATQRSGPAADGTPPPVVAPPGGPLRLAHLTTPRPLRGLPAPDVEGCGGLYTGGWAVTLGSFRSRGQARSLATRAARVYGGKPLTAPVGSGGLVRHHAFVAALSPGQARSICRQRRGRGDYCLVRSPKMMWAAMEAVQRLRRSMR